jgi:hypothetical protein
MTMPLATPTLTTRAAFHITDVILENENVTKALKEDGLEDISGILMLDDAYVEDFAYLDSDPNNTTAHCLIKAEIGLIKHSSTMFIIIMKLMI